MQVTIANDLPKEMLEIINNLDLRAIPESQHNEKLNQLIDKVTNSTEKLLDLHKKMKEIKDIESNNGPTNVTNNAMFFGSTSEAIKMIKEQMKSLNIAEETDK